MSQVPDCSEVQLCMLTVFVIIVDSFTVADCIPERNIKRAVSRILTAAFCLNSF